MDRLYTGEAESSWNINEENLSEKRNEAVTEMQRTLLKRFAERSTDVAAAALQWVDAYARPFRALVDNEPELVSRYMAGEKNVLEEIEKRIVQ